MFDEKEYQKNYQSKWYKENKHKCNQRSRDHYLKNKENILKKQRELYLINKDIKSEYQRQYSIKNKDKKKIASKKYYDTNKEIILLKQKIRKKNNPDKQFEVYLKFKYGISFIQYKQMLESQDFKCFICKDKLNLKDRKHLHVDHCHKSGKVRKILCARCNIFIGYLENRYINLMEKINQYIESERD